MIITTEDNIMIITIWGNMTITIEGNIPLAHRVTPWSLLEVTMTITSDGNTMTILLQR